jgi:hypothetical protein
VKRREKKKLSFFFFTTLWWYVSGLQPLSLSLSLSVVSTPVVKSATKTLRMVQWLSSMVRSNHSRIALPSRSALFGPHHNRE